MYQNGAGCGGNAGAYLWNGYIKNQNNSFMEETVMLDSLYYGLKAKSYELLEKKNERYWKKELKKGSWTCTTKEELIKALDSEKATIVVKGSAYNEILEVARKSQSSKTFKNVGVGAMVAGALILPGISAWISLGAGALAYKKGKVEDSLKKYKINVDEVKKEITLKR